MNTIVLNMTPFMNEGKNAVISIATSGIMFCIFAFVFSIMTVSFYDAKYPDWKPCSIISTILWVGGILCAGAYFGVFTFKVI